VSCAKTAELIEIQLWMLIRWVHGTCITWGVQCRCPHGKGHFWVSGQLKRIGKWWAVQKHGWTDFTICTSYDVFLCKELPFGLQWLHLR